MSSTDSDDDSGRGTSESDAGLERNSEGDSREKPEYVCFRDACTVFNLRNADLYDLECKTGQNPHHRQSAPVRFYLRSDIERLSKAKAERLAWKAEHADEIRAKKYAEKAAKKAAAKEHAKQCISSWKRPVQTLVDSGTPLPVDIWVRVLEALCADLEPEGVRGVSVVARDLCNAGMTCKELHGCALQAFNHLSSLCPAVRWEEEWNAFLRDPTSHKVLQLKALAYNVGAQSSLPKAALTMDILKELGVDRPSLVPIRVLKEVREEKFPHRRQLALPCSSIPALRRLHSVFSRRAKCMSLGLCTNELVKEEAQRLEEAERIRVQNYEKQMQQRQRDFEKWQQERARQSKLEQEARAQAMKAKVPSPSTCCISNQSADTRHADTDA